MAEVVMPLKEAQGGLPAVCAMTGQRADGAVPLKVGRTWSRWNAPEVRVPLSAPVFERWSRRQNIHIKARGIASVLTAIGVVLAFRSGLLAVGVLAVAVGIHLIDLWAERSAGSGQPLIERRGSDVVLSGVHERFADAVSQR